MAPPMRLVTCSIVLFLVLVLGGSSEAFEHAPPYRMTERADVGLLCISFFGAVVLLCAFAIARLWNRMRQDFPRIPVLGFGRSLALVVGLSTVFNTVLFCAGGPSRFMAIGGWEVGGVSAGLLHDDRGPPRRMKIE